MKAHYMTVLAGLALSLTGCDKAGQIYNLANNATNTVASSVLSSAMPATMANLTTVSTEINTLTGQLTLNETSDPVASVVKTYGKAIGNCSWDLSATILSFAKIQAHPGDQTVNDAVQSGMTITWFLAIYDSNRVEILHKAGCVSDEAFAAYKNLK